MHVLPRIFRRPVRLSFVALVAATAVLAALTSCSGSNPAVSTGSAASTGTAAPDLSGVTLKIADQKGQGLAGLLAAAGQLANLPYKLSWAEFTSGPPVMQALAAGAVDVGSVGDTPPIFAAAGRTNFRIVAAYRAGPNSQGILLPENSPIHTLADLKGRRVAVAKASAAEYMLLAALKKAGLTESDIDLVDLQPTNALAAFTTGKVDAWAIWEPYIAVAHTLAHATVLTNNAGLGTGLNFQVASTKALGNPGKEAALRDLLVRLARARLWAIAHNDQFATAWAKQVGIPAAVAKEALADQSLVAVPVDASVIRDEQEAADAFAGAGELPSRVDIAELADPRFNQAVAAVR